jgi:hypothetical protein
MPSGRLLMEVNPELDAIRLDPLHDSFASKTANTTDTHAITNNNI